MAKEFAGHYTPMLQPLQSPHQDSKSYYSITDLEPCHGKDCALVISKLFLINRVRNEVISIQYIIGSAKSIII